MGIAACAERPAMPTKVLLHSTVYAIALLLSTVYAILTFMGCNFHRLILDFSNFRVLMFVDGHLLLLHKRLI